MKKCSMYTFAVAMLAGMILTGCSSSEEIPGGTPDNGPKLKIETRRMPPRLLMHTGRFWCRRVTLRMQRAPPTLRL